MPRAEKPRFKPITGTGLSYLAGSLVFLFVGIMRGELVASISGIVLFSFMLFSGLLTAISCFVWRNTSFSVGWEEDDSFSLSLTGSSKKRFCSLYFTDIVYRIDYATSETPDTGRVYSLGVPVSSAAAMYRPELPPRGTYIASNPHLEIRDYAGFFSLTIPFPGTNITAPLVVLPARIKDTTPALPPGKTGRTRGKSSYKRSEDLYETRSYQPGDDPRKINWKIFAHTGELSIRQGELLPPPADEYVFLLYTGIPMPPTPRQKDRFDLLLARAARLAEKLLERNRSVMIITTDDKNRFLNVSIHPSDTGATESAYRAFSVPQLSVNTIPVEQVFALTADRATLLLFALPEQLSAVRLPRSRSPRTTCYLGPVSDPVPPQTVKQKFLNFILLNPSGYETGVIENNRTVLEETETRLRKEGFIVKKI